MSSHFQLENSLESISVSIGRCQLDNFRGNPPLFFVLEGVSLPLSLSVLQAVLSGQELMQAGRLSGQGRLGVERPSLAGSLSCLLGMPNIFTGRKNVLCPKNQTLP